MGKHPKLDAVDLSQRLPGRREYRAELRQRQLELLFLQRAMYERGLRGVVLVEGWDAAGKGASIRRLTERLDPRGFTVHPIGLPRNAERGRHYLHRFWTRLPDPGALAVFDRSWYGRVLVERVEGLAAEAEWRRAFDEINAFERMLVDDGVPVVKLFLHISADEQLRRFRERESSPFKAWKLTPSDWRNRERRDDYASAIDAMFARTSTDHAPWHAIPSEHKWYGRVAVVQTATRALARAFGVELELPADWRLSGD